MKKAVAIAAVVIILIAAGYYFGFSTTGQATDPKMAEFAKELTQSGTKMYGAFWCPHCNEQKADFGAAWSEINYVECSLPDRSQNTQCSAAGIKAYPTWEFGDGSRVEGRLTFSQLAEKAGIAFG